VLAKYRTGKVSDQCLISWYVTEFWFLTDEESAIGDVSFFRYCKESCRGRSVQTLWNCGDSLGRMFTLRLKLISSLQDKLRNSGSMFCSGLGVTETSMGYRCLKMVRILSWRVS
jgi:hypothetical protein